MTQRLRVALGFPGSSLSFAAALGLHQFTDNKHDVTIIHSELGAWDAFNALWVEALNMSEAGEVDLFAMLHSDSDPQAHWGDILIDEMDRTGADWISVMSPIKDHRGLVDLGIADPDNPWGCLRRFTTRELMQLPETVDAEDLGYPGECLLQGDGCMVADLRKPVFHQVDATGQAQVCFNFPTQVLRDANGKWTRRRESEDWYFSRRLFEAGGRAVATRKVRMQHFGQYGFKNWCGWGSYEDGDEETRTKWDRTGEVIDMHGFWKKDERKYHRHDAALSVALVEFFRNQQPNRKKSVVDFGCGLGQYVRELRAEGIGVDGFDGSPNTAELTGGLCNTLDLAEPFRLERFYDWAMCLEVLEHIPAEFESVAMDNLVLHADSGIVLSWGGPGQGEGGHGHYNEQPADYVLARMESRGFECDESASAALRAAATLPWFRENLMVFRRRN